MWILVAASKILVGVLTVSKSLNNDLAETGSGDDVENLDPVELVSEYPRSGLGLGGTSLDT